MGRARSTPNRVRARCPSCSVRRRWSRPSACRAKRFHELRARNDFPEPVLQLAATPLWLRSAIDAFLEGWDRRPGRRTEATLVRISEDGVVEFVDDEIADVGSRPDRT